MSQKRARKSARRKASSRKRELRIRRRLERAARLEGCATGSSDYNGQFSINEIVIGDSPDGISFPLLVEQPDELKVDLGRDTILTTAGEIILDAGNPGTGYVWNTGETSQSVLADSTGIYSVLVTAVNNCSVSDSISIIIDYTDLVNYPDKNAPLNIYPNPGKGKFYLRPGNSQKEDVVEVVLINSAGKTIYSDMFRNVEVNAVLHISLDKTPPGIYLMKIIMNGESDQRRVVIY